MESVSNSFFGTNNRTRTVAVLGGEAPMSVPCLYDKAQDTFFVGTGVPARAFEAQVGRCKIVAPKVLHKEAIHAKPWIGLPRRTGHIFQTTTHLQEIRHSYVGVNPERVEAASRFVVVQDDDWSCGINSGARFAAMLRQSIKNWGPYKNAAPRYGGQFGIPHIGPNPEGLQNHLRNQSELANTDIHQVCNVRFGGIYDALMDAMHKGRPAMVLFMTSPTSMHWVCLVGRNKTTGNWYYLNTCKTLYEIPGGDEELKHMMNMDNCMAQRLNFVERFNCVVSTGGLHEKD